MTMGKRCVVFLVTISGLCVLMTTWIHRPLDQISNKPCIFTLSTTAEKRKLIQELTSSLRTKLNEAVKTRNKTISFKTCKHNNIIDYDDTCKKGRTCLKQSVPEDLEARIESLVFPPNMLVPDRFIDILDDMRAEVKGNYDVIILHALSSNHFLESQAMLKNLHKVVYPLLKNFTLVVYDLGLKDAERKQYRKHCRCQLLQFPFQKLPDHFANLITFAWKVFIIAAHLEQAELSMWIDTSITITNGTELMSVIDRTRTRGVQQRCDDRGIPNPRHTLPQMFEAFGDSPCAHLSFTQCEAGFGIYHRELLIRHAVVGAWVTCAANPFCIEPVNQNRVHNCGEWVPGTIGNCMRSDQSAISLILAKLFREKMDHFAITTSSFQRVSRGQTLDYFKQIEKNANTI